MTTSPCDDYINTGGSICGNEKERYLDQENDMRTDPATSINAMAEYLNYLRRQLENRKKTKSCKDSPDDCNALLAFTAMSYNFGYGGVDGMLYRADKAQNPCEKRCSCGSPDNFVKDNENELYDEEIKTCDVTKKASNSSCEEVKTKCETDGGTDCESAYKSCLGTSSSIHTACRKKRAETIANHPIMASVARNLYPKISNAEEMTDEQYAGDNGKLFQYEVKKKYPQEVNKRIKDYCEEKESSCNK